MVNDSEIIGTNPWWRDAKSIEDDPEIVAWGRTKLRLIPGIMHEITYDFEPGNTVVYTLRGTRQVGKTTLMKLQIRQFLEDGTPPWNIFYYSFDLCKTPRELVDVMERYIWLAREMRDGGRRYIFLDEVSTIPNWQKGIKWLVDRGRVANSTVMATGSDAIDLRRSTERLPGRRGSTLEPYDRVLLPLKFSEYAGALDPEIKAIIDSKLCLQDRLEIFMRLANGEVDKTVEHICMYQDVLEGLLSKYMYSGGIPLVASSQVSAWPIREDVYNSYMNSIIGEWSRLGRDPDLLKRLGREIVKSHGSLASWNGMAKGGDIGTYKTVQDSVQTLTDLFVLTMFYGYDPGRKFPMFRRNKKIYFADPFFFHLFNGWTATGNYFDTSAKYLDSNENRGALVESIVASHLARLAFDASPNKQNFDHRYRIFYYMEDGKEADFVYHDGDQVVVPIEVKYRNTARRSLAGMYKLLNRTRGKGLVVSKDHLGAYSEYVMVPAPVFLLLA